ncbi:MAG TPA: hypothetical protein VKQ08_07775, partial [Cyclobacteriaceae bacterium]|nr:hypothetical protein [Cyclobacteriaceae bacterium]
MIRFFVLVLALFISHFALSQLRGLQIKKAAGKIVLDGVMDEPDWQGADVAGHFKQMFPFDSSYAIAQTEVRM